MILLRSMAFSELFSRQPRPTRRAKAALGGGIVVPEEFYEGQLPKLNSSYFR
jgi:hypothetical protein